MSAKAVGQNGQLCGSEPSEANPPPHGVQHMLPGQTTSSLPKLAITLPGARHKRAEESGATNDEQKKLS